MTYNSYALFISSPHEFPSHISTCWILGPANLCHNNGTTGKSLLKRWCTSWNLFVRKYTHLEKNSRCVKSRYLTEMIVISVNKTVIPEVNNPRLKLLYCIHFREPVYQTCNKHLKIEIIIMETVDFPTVFSWSCWKQWIKSIKLHKSFSTSDLCEWVQVLCFSTNEESYHLFRVNDG